MRYEGSLTDIPGVLVGHWTNKQACTGCTAVLVREGAVGGVDVRGAAPGTRETDLLRGYHLVQQIHAIMLSGGSAFGLAAADGAMRYLEAEGIGFDTGYAKVPIVPAAVIYDLGVGSASIRPDAQSGYEACAAASASMLQGAVGAGTGATASKLRGPGNAVDAGLGSACVGLDGGGKIAALVVANPLGEIFDPATGQCLTQSAANGRPVTNAAFSNTLIGVVATDIPLTREEANRLAMVSHDGIARCVRPAHTPMDGDTMFAISTHLAQCGMPPEKMLILCQACADVTARAIVNAIVSVEK